MGLRHTPVNNDDHDDDDKIMQKDKKIVLAILKYPPFKKL